VRFEIRVLAQTLDVVLDQDQSRPVSGDRKPSQHRQLSTLHVDGQKINMIETGFRQDCRTGNFSRIVIADNDHTESNRGGLHDLLDTNE
jgi:hypothetical protein